jgi:micrococcal nuclease
MASRPYAGKLPVRYLLALLVLALAAAVVAASARPAHERAFTLRGTVTYVVDGDTLDVRLDDGRRERVRLIGIDTPERGACLSGPASAQARRLADDKRVVLRGDATQDTRDRYGRLLAYAWVRGRDLGFQQVTSGLARVYVYGRPFQRLGAYRRAEQAGQKRARNVWRGCPVPTPPAAAPRASCDPSYPTVCIPPPPPDLDCADVPHSNFAVRGADPHRFDGEGDGVGCEG